MRKVLNKNKLFYFVMISLILVVIIIIGVKFTLEFLVKDDKNVVTKKELDSLELYGYTLDDYDSDLYKEYFNDLKSTLNNKEVNYENYAKEIVKLFVSDFYTLDNKLTSSDIGGVEFIPSDMVENFKMHAGDTMYNHVKTNIYGDRVQELPIVKKVDVTNLESITYTYKDKEYSGYIVSASWEYQEDLGYKNSEIFTLIKDNNKLYIVVGE
mgnify:FL=1